jgi:hypothetical protein
MKGTDPNAHIRILKKANRTNGEIMELVDIINLFSFILQNNILEWGEKFVQNYPNSTFEELEPTFSKCEE